MKILKINYLDEYWVNRDRVKKKEYFKIIVY